MITDTVIVPLTYDFARENASALLAVSEDIEWDEWTRDDLLIDLPSKWKLSLVALDERRSVAGYILASAKPHPHVHRLMVSPWRRGQGVGRHLMESFLDRCKRLGCEVAAIKTHATNTPSLRLQQSLGFVVVDTSATGYVELRKRLG